MDAAEYKHVVLGLIFLKYISDAFEERRAVLVNEQYADPEDRDEYTAENVFWVPKSARWHNFQANAKQPTIGKLIDDAMVAIEKANPSLKGILPKNYARPGLDKQRLGELIDLIGSIGFGTKEDRSKDILGRVYEYFLGEFASAEGKKGGEFYTPRCIVHLLVEMLQPYHGRVYDPCCGSSGMFVQSEEFIVQHGGRLTDISVYGQESNPTTWQLARMNLAIRGIEANLGPHNADSFHNDLHKDLKADFILANPPFNMKEWGGERLKGDIRWKYGPPPAGNANFAWVQHIIHHLSPRGVAGFVLGNISLSSETGGEDVIRRGIVDANLIDCIMTLPDRLFYSTPIRAGIWIVRRSRASAAEGKRRKNEILFIDASRSGRDETRTHRELTDSDIALIAKTYRQWCECSPSYRDRTGFCRSAPVRDVVKNQYNLLPAAYVNLGHIKPAEGLRLGEAINGPEAQAMSGTLEELSELRLSFEEAIKQVRKELKLLEGSLTFDTRRLGDLLEECDDRLEGADEPEVLTVTERGGLILQRERFAKRVATEDATKYKLVRMGDIVYNPYLLWKGAIGQCWIVELGITSPAYEVFKVRPEFDKTIIGQLVTSPEMIKRYDGISFGTVQRRRRAPVERFLELRVSIPAPEHMAKLGALLAYSQASQFAARNTVRSIRDFLSSVCAKLR